MKLLIFLPIHSSMLSDCIRLAKQVHPSNLLILNLNKIEYNLKPVNKEWKIYIIFRYKYKCIHKHTSRCSSYDGFAKSSKHMNMLFRKMRIQRFSKLISVFSRVWYTDTLSYVFIIIISNINCLCVYVLRMNVLSFLLFFFASNICTFLFA